MRLSVCRKEHFNAAHRLHNSNWSDEENRKIFGVCNSPNYHGHNYILTVKITGDLDEEIGYIIDLKLLSILIRKEIVERFDHKNLNLDVKEFQNLNPTTENIAVVIWKIMNSTLKKKIDKPLDLKIILHETERNFVEYPASS